MRLKVSVVSISGKHGEVNYHNKVNAENFREIALLLSDLNNLGIPIEKAIKEFNRIKSSDWEAIIGN